MKITWIGIAAFAVLAGCSDNASVAPTGAVREQDATKTLQDAAAVAVGMPGIINFTEKRMMKMLYELRDTANLVTYSYYVDLNGGLHKICPTTSVGFGIPFSAQYTAPSVDGTETGYQSVTTITRWQPEPNGLYMPESSSATWVICFDEKAKKPVPVYVEPSIIVSPFPLSGAPS